MNIKKIIAMFKKNDVECTINNNVIDHLCREGYQPEYGARPIKRLIQHEIISEVSKYLLENPGSNNLNISFDTKINIEDNINTQYQKTG